LNDRRKWETKTEARLALFTYIEGWFNPRRRHRALGQTSPANLERKQLAEPYVSPKRDKHGIPSARASRAPRRRWISLHLSSSSRIETHVPTRP